MKGKKKAKAKQGGAVASTTSGPWYLFWVAHPDIIFQRTFGPGEVNLIAQNKPGVFKLVPRKDDRGRVIGYSVDATQGNLPPAWNGVNLSPRGTVPLGPIGGALPPYDSNDQAIIKLYDSALNYLVSRLNAANTDYQRLEGYFPVFDSMTGTLNIDRVRIVNIPQFVDLGDEKTQDHSLLVLTLLEGISVNQNGGGSGPPDP